jgi:hypothetical protein
MKKITEKKMHDKKLGTHDSGQTDYPAPSVEHAEGSTLDPSKMRGGVKVVIEMESMSPSERYKVHFLGPLAEARPDIDDQPGNSSGRLEFFIPEKVMGLCIGHTVPIFYTVKQNGVWLGDSIPLDLTITQFSTSDPDIPGVYLVEAGAGENVDLAKFKGNVNATLVPYPFIAAGQRVWCRVDGTAEDDQPLSRWLMVAYEVLPYEVLNGFKFQISRYFLNQLKNWSSIDIHFFLKYDKDTSLDVEPVQAFRVTTKGIRQTPGYAFYDGTGFEFENMNGWEKGPAVNDPRDLIIRRDGDDWYAHFYTYTAYSAGVLLEKSFDRLELGREYSFSVFVQRANSAYEVPELSLSIDGGESTPVTQFPSRESVKLELVFIAKSAVMTLKINSHVATNWGNDFNLRQIVVTSI